MNSTLRIALIIIGSAGVTFLTRLLPFLFFGGDKKVPDIIIFIEKYLPGMVMVILVIYCFKDLALSDLPASGAMILSAITVALLHLVQKNTLVSIFGGTILYMVLIQNGIIGKIMALVSGG